MVSMELRKFCNLFRISISAMGSQCSNPLLITSDGLDDCSVPTEVKPGAWVINAVAQFYDVMNGVEWISEGRPGYVEKLLHVDGWGDWKHAQIRFTPGTVTGHKPVVR